MTILKAAGSDRVTLRDAVTVQLMRTLRLPDDGRDHPLPPGFGSFPVYAASSLPGWAGAGDLVVPVHAREALWLSFSAPHHKPRALKVGVGSIDAISGVPFIAAELSSAPQDYVVVPDQPWLDGINAGHRTVRQFVVVPLGAGLTVEAQLAGEERGGLELVVFEPKPGRFPDEPPEPSESDIRVYHRKVGRMGIGAGGSLRQEIYKDHYGPKTWEPTPSAHLRIQLVDAIDFAALTGLPIPPTPITAATYADHGLPWFELYDPIRRDIAPAAGFRDVESVSTVDGHDTLGVSVSPGDVVRYIGTPPAQGA